MWTLFRGVLLVSFGLGEAWLMSIGRCVVATFTWFIFIFPGAICAVLVAGWRPCLRAECRTVSGAAVGHFHFFFEQNPTLKPLL